MEIMALRKSLATNVKKRRKDLGWSQDALAKRAGTVQSHISRLERSESGVTVDVVGGCAGAFGCQPWELLMDDDAVRREAIERMLGARPSALAPIPPQPRMPQKRVAHKRKPPRAAKI